MVNAAASRLGVRSGMTVSAAHGLTAPLRVHGRDASAERATLDRLAAWAGQFTSMVSLMPPQALLLEVEGSRRLFGGLDRLREGVRQGLAELGYHARLALAPTPLGAAWLARAGGEPCITDRDALVGALSALPLACLDLPGKARDALAAMGVQRLGECLRLPRDGLARRLGPELVRRFDRALGRHPDPRPAFVAPPVFNARLLLPAPLDNAEALLFPLRRLLLELSGFLKSRALGAQSLRFDLHHPKAATTGLALDLVAPSCDAQHLTALLRERLERVILPEPVEEVALASTALRPAAARNLDFFAPARSPREARVLLLERLQVRLGRQAIHGLEAVAEHRPERAWRYVDPGTSGGKAVFSNRPLWLLPEPVRLVMQQDRLILDGVLSLGRERERIESGWWDGQDVARDYFIARNPRGACFWIFRELTAGGGWFLHGIFS